MRVEIVIPHHNRAPLLRRALEALREQTHAVPVCVADNASTDGTAEMLAREFADVRHLGLERNYGFGAAINRAVGSSSAELIVLVNNDTAPAATFIERLVASHELSGAEMVAACLIRPDGRVDSLGVQVDTALNAYDFAHGADPGELPAGEPLAPSGGAAAYARSAFEEIGGFDERIFAYLEDVDLGIRMRLRGMRCAVARDAVAHHEHAGTLGRGSARKNFLLGRARGYLLWKYGRNLGWRDRMNAGITDAVVYSGQAVFDRNLGSVRGRLANHRASRGVARPGPEPAWASLQLAELTLCEGLSRRLGRRRR